jgi:hypothetical protein
MPLNLTARAKNVVKNYNRTHRRLSRECQSVEQHPSFISLQKQCKSLQTLRQEDTERIQCLLDRIACLERERRDWECNLGQMFSAVHSLKWRNSELSALLTSLQEQLGARYPTGMPPAF